MSTTQHLTPSPPPRIDYERHREGHTVKQASEKTAEQFRRKRNKATVSQPKGDIKAAKPRFRPRKTINTEVKVNPAFLKPARPSGNRLTVVNRDYYPLPHHQIQFDQLKAETIAEREKYSLGRLQDPSKEKGRPPHSIRNLVLCAILASPERRLTLREIRITIRRRFAFYGDENEVGWLSSLRQCLSWQGCFKMVLRPEAGHVGSWWTVVNNEEPKFQNRIQVMGKPATLSPLGDDKTQSNVELEQASTESTCSSSADDLELSSESALSDLDVVSNRTHRFQESLGDHSHLYSGTTPQAFGKNNRRWIGSTQLGGSREPTHIGPIDSPRHGSLERVLPPLHPLFLPPNMSDNHRPMRQPHLVGNNVPTILPSIRTMGLPGFDSSSSGPSQLPQVARHSRYLDQYSYAEVHSLSSGLTSGQSWLDSVATSEGYMHLSDCARSVPSQLCPCKGQAGVRNTAVPTALSEGMHYRASSCRYEPEMRWNAKPYGIKKKSKGLL